MKIFLHNNQKSARGIFKKKIKLDLLPTPYCSCALIVNRLVLPAAAEIMA